MSYWGNTYYPMVDALVDDFARGWVEQVGNDINHNWPPYMGSECDDETVLDYIRRAIDDGRDDWEMGVAEGEREACGSGGYEHYLFDALRYAIVTVLEGDM